MKSNQKLQPIAGLPDHGRDAPHGAEEQPRRDASALQDLLAREFPLPEAEERKTAKPARLTQLLSPLPSRILKSLAGLAILASVGWMPLQRLFQVSSVEAVVNAQVITLRAPISGVVSAELDPVRTGAAVTPGHVLATLRNERADHGGIERVTTDLQAANEDLATTGERIERLTALRSAIAARTEAYRADRIRRVDADLAVAGAQIASAEAVLERAEAEAQRQASLSANGFGAQATQQTAERDLAVARASAEQARARKASLTVEADALNAGRFFGDSYNDVPQSAQRLDQIDETLASLQAEKGRLATRVARLASDLDSERGRFELASKAAIVAPAGGRIWERLTSPGEQVVAGQPLVSLLDCSKLVVTAAISEAVYNTLSVGMPAAFTFSGGGPAFLGEVVQLSGVAAAGSTFAIIPSALTKEPYRATVHVGDLTHQDACPVGQTGRVVFGSSRS